MKKDGSLPKRNAGSVRAVNRSGTLNFSIKHTEKVHEKYGSRIMTPKASRFQKTPPPPLKTETSLVEEDFDLTDIEERPLGQPLFVSPVK